MKSTTVLFILCFLQVSHRSFAWLLSEQTLPLDDEQEECIKELKLDRSTIARLSAQQFPPEDNPQFNNFFACAWKKQGYMHQDGWINDNALEKMIFDALKEQAGTSSSAINVAKQMASTAISDCNTVVGKSPGEVAVKMQNCLYRRLIQFSEE